MKKILSLVLTLAMVMSLTTIAWAAEPTEVEVSTNAALAEALKTDAEEVVINLTTTTPTDGEKFIIDLYSTSSVPHIKSLTINGNGETKVSFHDLQVNCALFDELTINNCEILHMNTKGWGHLVFGSSGTTGVYTVSDCVFNGVGTTGIYFNPEVNGESLVIENCTFNGDFGAEGAVVVQNNSVPSTLTVSDNNFNDLESEAVAIWWKDETLDLTSDVAAVTMVRNAAQFEAAATAAEAGDTIKLMGDVDLTALETPVEITTPINIDDNGNELTGLVPGSDITTNAEGKITGGVFAEDVTDYIAEGVEIEVVDNNWIVGNSINNGIEGDERESSEPTPAEIERDRVVAAIKSAEDGETVVLDVKDTSVVSRFIADAMSGKNVNLEYALGEETVTVNGKSVPKTPAYRVWYSLELFSQFA